MKKLNLVLASLMFMQTLSAEAAYKNHAVENKFTVITDGRVEYKYRTQSYSFLVEILGDNEGLKAESQKNGRPFINAKNEERYAVRLHNPLPVRVAVNLTVDGLNSLSGKPNGISDGQKWIIDPYSFITIRGWQVNQGEARRFFFTEKPKSYAEWRGETMQKDLSVNCGVIGAAYFWNKRELQNYYDQHPTTIYTRQTYRGCELKSRADAAGGKEYEAASNGPLFDKSRNMRKAPEENQQAGTGMGERESHSTQLVDFRYDTGMYKLTQAIVIYYDFAKPNVPNPFPDLSYAPEMPGEN